LKFKIENVIEGAKAGASAGIVIGALSFLGNYYLLAILYRHEISLALGRPYTPSMIGLMGNSILTAIVLTICGILYALLYDRLRVKKPFWKAFVFGLAIFITSRVGDITVDYPISPSLTLASALYSAPFLLLLYPYLLSKRYVLSQLWRKL